MGSVKVFNKSMYIFMSFAVYPLYYSRLSIIRGNGWENWRG
jgi:hypothetical protein